ncbi:MAG: chorismate synthase [Bacteroidales bacterium]|nr:chorismate synthase [Bacteroidales bacterium]
MNTFGNNFRISIFGESHGECIGTMIDGVPEGLRLSEEDFTADIDRRRSGAKGTTPRHEADKPQIVSGLYEGHTTGSPLTILFRNENTRSADYEQLTAVPRPGHADYPAMAKWHGKNDPRGGGHFSGRLTLPLVAAGVVAKKILSYDYVVNDSADKPKKSDDDFHRFFDISVKARLVEVGGIDTVYKDAVDARLNEAIMEGDSLGGVVECTATNVPVGLGEPFFNSVESLISHAVFSIPGVRGIEFGDGFDAARMKGSEHNDPIGRYGFPSKNGAGGVNGGLTNGAPVVFRVAFKPTSSISMPQRTLNLKTGRMNTLRIRGRHDVCFALRTPVIVEAVTAIVLADLFVSMK